jgi:ATP-binding cassette, subfamily B, multidrug efflux pump
MGQFRLRYSIGTVFLALTIFLTCAMPWLLRMLIGTLDKARQVGGEEARIPDRVYEIALWIMLTALAMAIARIGSRIGFLGGGRKVGNLLREKAFGQLVHLAPSFYARMSTGDLISRLTSDINVCQGVCGPGILYAINGVFLYIGCLIFMSFINLKMTLLIFLPYPFLIFVVNKAAHHVKEHSKLSQQAAGRLTNRVQETLAGMVVVKGFVMEDSQEQRFATANQEVLKHNMAQVLGRGLIQLFIGLATGIASLIVLWIGGRSIALGTLDFADFVAFFGYMGLLVQPTVYLGWVTSSFARGGPALERVQELINATRTITDQPDAHNEEVRGQVELQSLSYRYPTQDSENELKVGERRPALIDVSVKVGRGRILGLFGRVGSGKSTLLRAIPRLIELDPGTVLIDGIAAEKWSLDRLRTSIGYVPQDGALFSMSLAENIALGRESENPDQLSSVLALSCLDRDLDQFPKGLDTLVGERGVTLSGGQRQRTAIARALYLKPKIMLLDDALSMVDAETASEILKGLGKALKELTVLVAAHRTATLLEADEILVLDQGRVVERGTPKDLLDSGGIFAQAHERQRLQEQLEQS